MTLIRDPADTGWAWRFLRAYRHCRRDQHPKSPETFRMPRRAAWQIAKHQASNRKIF